MGRSGSTHRKAVNWNVSKSSTPKKGVTTNDPDVGGALVMTTMEAEAARTRTENVNVAPAGSVFAGRARFITTGEEDWANGVIVKFTGVKDRASRL